VVDALEDAQSVVDLISRGCVKILVLFWENLLWQSL
jgi:hypothetical protein